MNQNLSRSRRACALLVAAHLVGLPSLCLGEGLKDPIILASAEQPTMSWDMAETVLAEAYRRLGQPLKFQRFGVFERMLVEANAGRVDGDAMRSSKGFAQYPNLIVVDVPVASDDMVAFAKGNVVRPDGWRSLLPYRLGSLRGIKSLEELGPEFNIYFASTVPQAAAMLRAGRFDLLVINRSTQCRMEQLGFNDLRIQEPAITKFSYYHHLHNSHAELAKQVERTLQGMKRDGSLEKLQQQVRDKWKTCQAPPESKP